MGLYDNYRQTNSTAIPQFAGSFLPEMKEAQASLSADYDTALLTSRRVKAASDSAQVLAGDQADYAKVYGKINADLKQVSGRQDYENMIPLTDEIARNAAVQLKPFADRAMGKAAYDKEVNDSKLDINAKQGLIAMSADNDQRYGKRISVNPVTGLPEGRYVGKPMAEAVDLPAWTDKMIAAAHPREAGKQYIKMGTQWMVKDGIHTVKLGDLEIKKILSEAYQLSPEVGAYVNQQAELTGWAGSTKFTQGTFDKMLDTEVDSKGVPRTNKLKQDIKAAMDGGLTAREAKEKVSSDYKRQAMYTSMENYATGKYHRNDLTTTVEYSEMPDYGRAQAEKKEHEFDAMLSPTPGIDPNTDDSFEKLDTRVKNGKISMLAAQANLSKYYKFDTAGNLQMDSHGIVRTGVPIPNESTGMVTGMVDSYFQAKHQLGIDEGMKKHALNQSAVNNGYASYSDAQLSSKTQWSEAIGSDSRATYRATTQVNHRSAPVNVNKAELVSALSSGEAKPEYNAFGALISINMTKEGKVTNIPFGSGNSYDNAKNGLGTNMEAGVNRLERINKGARDKYQDYRKGYSLNGAGITFDGKGKDNSEAAFLQRHTANELNTNIGAYKVYPAGKMVMGSSEMNAADIDFKGAEIGGYQPIGNGQSLVNASVKDKAGKAMQVQVLVPASSTIGQHVKKMAATSSDPRIQRLGKAFDADDAVGNLMFTPNQGVARGYGEERVLKPSSDPTKEVKGSPVKVTAEASSGTTQFFVEYWNPEKNAYEKYEKGKMGEYSTTDALEASSIAEAIAQQYEKPAPKPTKKK